MVEPFEPANMSAVSNPLGVGSKAAAKSAIQVVPICATSGVVLPAIAVWYLLCAASHGIAVTLTFTPGFAASNCLSRPGSACPSAPCAHNVIVPVAGPLASPPGEGPDPAVSSRPH